MNTYPLLFENLVQPQIPDDLDAPISYDPQQWLQAIVEQADCALEAWEDAWPNSSRAYCGNAREHAQAALQALATESVDIAMLSAFRAGIFIEKAQRDFPVEDWLKQKKKRSKTAKKSGAKGGKSPRKRKLADTDLHYIFRHATDEEKTGSLSLDDCCSRLKKNTGVAVTTKTMRGRLKRLGYPYKGKRK